MGKFNDFVNEIFEEIKALIKSFKEEDLKEFLNWFNDDSDEDIPKNSDELIDYIDDLDQDEIIEFLNALGQFMEIAPEEESVDESDLNEMTRSQRIKASRRMKAKSGKLKRTRERALKKRAGAVDITRRAKKAALQAIKQGISKGKDYDSMNLNQKEMIDKKAKVLLKKKPNMLQRMIKKFKKIKRETEMSRRQNKAED